MDGLQVGVATIAAAVQRAGGSVAHPGNALDEALEQKAASIEGNAGPEASSLGAPPPASIHDPWLGTAADLHGEDLT